MTPAEWVAICTHVRALWGDSDRWDAAKEDAYSFAEPLDADLVLDAITAAMFENRAAPPSLSEIITPATERQAERRNDRMLVAPCSHARHAILTYHDSGQPATGLCAQCREPHTWKDTPDERLA